MPSAVVCMVGGGPAASPGLCTGLGARWGWMLPPTSQSFQTRLEGSLENSTRSSQPGMQTTSELLSPTTKPPPGLSSLLSAGRGPFSTGDGLFTHWLRLARPVWSTWVRPGTQSHRDAVTEGTVCPGRRASPPGAGTEPRELGPTGAGDVLRKRRLPLPVFPCLMEALLETEQSVYPYFCPGIGVFIASTRCCDEHCRNMLLQALPVGVHLGCVHVCTLAHTCTGKHTPHRGPRSQPQLVPCHWTNVMGR